MRLHHALALLLFLLPLAAQEGLERIEVRVTALGPGGVFVDAGSAAGVSEGDRARLYPVGLPAVGGIVRKVEAGRSLVEVRGDVSGLEPGVRGEVLVNRRAAAAPPGAAAPAEGGGTQHPEWSAPPEEWSSDLPLLAPALAPEPEERPREWSGRAWAGLDLTHESGPVSNDYRLIRAGLDLLADNPFGHAGRLDVSVDGFQQYADTSDGSDQDDARLRATRLSYAWGGQRGRSERWQVGRFLQHEFPEFGLLDGAEYGHRFEGGSRVGASVGFLPEPTDALETGKDLGLAVFGTLAGREDERFLLGGGFQKTWHNGAPDRDLLVVKSSWVPAERTRVLGTAWVDFYDDTDTLKSSAAELTQLTLNAMRDWAGGHGLSLFANHVRWPDIERNEFTTPPPVGIADYLLTRAGARGWGRVNEHVRLSGEASWWQDEDDTGTYAEVGTQLQDLLWERGTLGLSVFDTQGKFSNGLGWRVYADRAFEAGLLTVGWDVANYEQPGFSGSQSDLYHHLVRASWDMPFWSSWDLSLWGEYRFGDQQDASRAGFFVQRRF